MTVRFHPEAQAELGAAIAWYEEQSSGTGVRLRREVEEAVELLQGNPNLGSFFNDTAYRRWPVRKFPYLIFYRVQDEVLFIVAVAHGRRRPGYWKTRASE